MLCSGAFLFLFLFYFFHYEYSIHHCIQSYEKTNIQKQRKRRKEGRNENKKGIAPYQKRETNFESVQAQMPLLKNTLLVSQIV